MHGGAAGSGAPIGNKNALKNGRYTRRTRLTEARMGRSFGRLLDWVPGMPEPAEPHFLWKPQIARSAQEFSRR
jgi:hypothetical protein